MPNADKPDEPSYTASVALPKSMNPGLTAAKHKTMIEFLGRPGALTENCSDITSDSLNHLTVTKNVGPFSVKGLKPAVEALIRVFNEVKKARPALHDLLRSDGMSCVRRVRKDASKPPSKNFSNHSWGTAVDIKIGTKKDTVGDAKALFGLVALAPFFNAERFFWGAGFKPASEFEDAMHFEASEELIHDWKKAGLLG